MAGSLTPDVYLVSRSAGGLCPSRTKEISCGQQSDVYARGMDQASGKRDDGRNGGYGSRAERPVGAPEGSVFEWIGVDGRKDLGRQRTHQGAGGGLRHR